MIAVQFPEPQFKTKTRHGKRYIFDGIRRAWLLLTEEEWVRQNMVAFLLQSLGFPAAHLALEKGVQVNGLPKRFDLLVYNRDHQPWMLVECKAPDIALNEDVLQQVLRYNMATPVSFLVITNGRHTLAWEKKAGNLASLQQWPQWPVTG